MSIRIIRVFFILFKNLKGERNIDLCFVLFISLLLLKEKRVLMENIRSSHVHVLHLDSVACYNENHLIDETFHVTIPRLTITITFLEE